VASANGSVRRRARFGRMAARSLQPSAHEPAVAGLGLPGADLRRAPADGLGTAARGRCYRLPAFDGLEGSAPARHLEATHAAARGRQPLRVAVPGDLLHMDTARYARFLRPGHAVTGDRSQRSRNWMAPETRVGYDFAHAIVDDHSRLAYVELHQDERAQTVTAFVERALAWFEQRGVTARRLMTDNAFSYVRNRSLRELLARRGIKHIRTQPYRPRTNGKVERFHQTMGREWAKGLAYRTHRHRNQALPHWLEHYNQRRPHSSLGGKPPISRLHNLRGQDS